MLRNDFGFIDLMSYCLVVKQSKSAWSHVGLHLRARWTIDAYKKVMVYGRSCRRERAIVKLEIPKGALIVVGDEFVKYGKLRTNRAEVISITSISGKTNYERAFSSHNNNFEYTPGTIIVPELKFDPCYATCASGIHFFVNRSDAVAYRI